MKLTFDKYFEEYLTDTQLVKRYDKINRDASKISTVFKGSAISRKLGRRVAKRIAKALHKSGDNLDDFKDRNLQAINEENGFKLI